VGRGDDQALVVRQRSTALTKRGQFVGRGDEGALIYHVQVAERNVAVGRIARQPEHLHDDQLAGATAAGQHLELVVRALGDRVRVQRRGAAVTIVIRVKVVSVGVQRVVLTTDV